MAAAFVKTHTIISSKTSGTTIDIGIGTTVIAGNTIVAFVLFDNAATASKPIVSSIAKPAGETNNWVFLGAARSTSTSAGAFASGEMWAITASVAWSGVFNVTLDTSVTMRAALVAEFSGLTSTLRCTSGSAYSTTTTQASATTTGTTPVIGDIAIGFAFQSNASSISPVDTDTLGGTWSGAAGLGSTGSTAATNNYGAGQYKILTGANHQTYNVNAALTAGNGAIVAILQQYAPTITQKSYRIYADGTETGSTALAAQNTSYTADVTAGDVNLQVRTLLQTATSDVMPIDDFQLQWEKNASGSWTNVAAVNTVVGYNSPNLTDGAATTNRLTGGTGTFVAGKVSEDGLVDDVGWTTAQFTELLYSITLKKADLANSDTLRFRVVRNGSTTGFTYTQTPTISITLTRPKTSTLVDTFDTQINPAVWAADPNVVWEAGRAKFPSKSTYPQIASVASYDFTGSFVFLRFWYAPYQPNVTTSRENILQIWQDNNNHVDAVVSGTGIVPGITLRVREGGVNNDSNVQYLPTEYPWIRLRMSGTTVYLDGSRDGANWVALLNKTTTLALTSAKVVFSAGQWAAEADEQNAYIDNLNTVTGAAATPKLSTITDTFASKIDVTQWTSSGTVIWESGQAKLTTLNSGYSFLSTRYPFDLTNSSFFCKMTPPVVVRPSREFSLRISDTANNNNVMGFLTYDAASPSNWSLNFRTRESGTNYNTWISNYDPVAHAYLRIRMSGTTVYGDTSPDGATWTNRWSKVTASDLSSVQTTIECGQWQTEADNGSGYIDNVNTVPGTGAGIWNGTSWRTDAEIWNGTSWRTDAEVFNGTSWIPLG